MRKSNVIKYNTMTMTMNQLHKHSGSNKPFREWLDYEAKQLQIKKDKGVLPLSMQLPEFIENKMRAKAKKSEEKENFANVDANTDSKGKQLLTNVGSLLGSAAGEFMNKREQTQAANAAAEQQPEVKTGILGMPKPVFWGVTVLVAGLVVFGVVRMIRKKE
jgi:hypothetical protein